MEPLRVVIVPGNGCIPVRECHWYTWLEETLIKDPSGRFTVILEDMPDPYFARESQWVPFIRQTLKVDTKTILVGHSSGCNAIMRLLEHEKVLGVVLVCASYSDQGSDDEKASEYFDRPWEWETIRKNAQWIVQLHSPDDDVIPVAEGRVVAEQLKSEYMELEDRCHFMDDELPEVVELIKKKCLNV